MQDKWYMNSIQCPDCQGTLDIYEKNIRCVSCSYATPFNGKQLNLLPQSPRPASFLFSRKKNNFTRILDNIDTRHPALTFAGPKALRNSTGFFSILEKEVKPQAAFLDIGCGPRDQAQPAVYLGYNYVGIDVSGPEADILADAHALPFQDNSFDAVLSFAVFEHLHNPFVALAEAERILRPGGVLVGAVSQGEPFHNSFFHCTPLGLISLVDAATTMHIERLWDSLDTLESLSRMGRYPRVIRWMLSLLNTTHQACPFLAPRRMGWPPEKKRQDNLFRAGSICFVIRKTGLQGA